MARKLIAPKVVAGFGITWLALAFLAAEVLGIVEEL